jgi:hypothetical protein
LLTILRETPLQENSAHALLLCRKVIDIGDPQQFRAKHYGLGVLKQVEI